MIHTPALSSSTTVPPAPAPTPRRPFQAPQIVIERELKSLAQGIGPFSGTP